MARFGVDSGKELIIACVYWQGDFRKRAYKPHWVRRLRNMVKRNLKLPHRFVAFTNVPDELPDIETVELTAPHLKGWWAKIELFRPDAFPENSRVLYLDLDTLITGKLEHIVNYPANIAFMPPSYKFRDGVPAMGKGIVDRYQSSCFVKDADTGHDVWYNFHDGVMDEYRGDQDWIGETLPLAKTMPPQWFSKLRGFEEAPKPGVKVHLCMPFKNDIASKKFEWVRKTWR